MSAANVAAALVQDTFRSAPDGLATFRAEVAARTWSFVIIAPQKHQPLPPSGSCYPVGLVETSNGGPAEVDYVIPGNDHWNGPQAPASWLRAHAAPDQQEPPGILQRCQQRRPSQQLKEQ